MDEFVGRMATQRHILNLVNSKVLRVEPLFGLSASAISRWAQENGVPHASPVVSLLKRVSSELFFMATRSQEPVSSEYELRRDKVLEAVAALECAVSEDLSLLRAV